MRIDQERSPRQRGLRRPLFAVKHERRIRTVGSNGRGDPGDEEAEIDLAQIDVGSKQADCAPGFRHGERQHTDRPAEMKTRMLNDLPTRCANLDGPAIAITQVESEKHRKCLHRRLEDERPGSFLGTGARARTPTTRLIASLEGGSLHRSM